MGEENGMGTGDLGALQGALFAEIHRLAGIDRGNPKAVEREVEVAEAMRGLAETAISNANTVLRVVQVGQQLKGAGRSMPRMLGGGGQ